MIAEPDIDLEELECRLYSQVYHENSEDVINQVVPEHRMKNGAFTDNNPANTINRYFQPHNFNVSLKLGYNDERRGFIPMNFSRNDQLLPIESSANSNYQNNSEWNQSNMPEVRVLNPINNFVVLPQIPTVFSPTIKQFLERRSALIEKKKARRKARRKEKQQQRRFRKELVEESGPGQKVGDFTAHYLNQSDTSAAESKPPEIIDVVDSDDSSCVEIVNDAELVVLSSDETDDDSNSQPECELTLKEEEGIKTNKEALNIDVNNTTLDDEHDDDVLLIEPKPDEIVVINEDDTDCVVDLNTKSIADDDASKQIDGNKSTETTSMSSEISSQVHAVTPTPKNKKTAKERKELLSTPDSTLSNDFLDASVSLKDDKFNFGLHGTDFRHSHSFLKPKCLADVYETESSCSASDISASLKNPFFNEIEFETPKQTFDAANIENFGNYITPNRQSETIEKQLTFEQVKTKAIEKFSKMLGMLDGGGSNSDSSSESEYESTKVTYLDKIKKTLPTLSPIQSDDERNKNKESDRDREATPKKSTSNACDVNVEESVSKKRKSHTCGESGVKKSKVTVEKEKSGENSKKRKKNLDKDINLTGETSTRKNSKTIEGDTRKQNVEKNSINAENVSQNISDKSNVSISIGDSSDEDNFATCDLENVETDLKLVNFKSFSSDDPIYEKSEMPSIRKRFLDYWSTDMGTYYNSTLDLAHFDVEASQKAMSGDPKMWKILDRDRVHIALGTPKGIRCHRCRQFGHMLINCPNKLGPPSCTLCGLKGHLEPRCPNAMCTSCGARGAYTTYCSKCAHWRKIQCTTCKMYGHYDNWCPDLWRRYHLTTTPGPIIKPDSRQSKPRKKRWCSGCSMSGHYEHTCRFYNRMHHPTDPEIKRYVDVAGYQSAEIPSTSRASVEISEVNPRNIDSKSKSNQRLEPNRYEAFTSVNFNENPAFPPLRMIPPYFQDQLAYLRSSTSENFKHQAKVPGNKSDYTFASKVTPSFIGFNFQRTFINNICKTNASKSGVQETIFDNPSYTTKLELNRFKYAYIHSTKGIDYINNIRRITSVNVTITTSNDDSNSGGTIILCGNQKDVCNINKQLNDFIETIPHKILPTDSKLAYITIHKNIDILENAKGNCKEIFDAISAKETQLLVEPSTRRSERLANDVMELYSTLHMILFGRCKVKNGEKHLNILYTWLAKLRNSDPHELPLNFAYDIYESFSYLFTPKLQKDDYRYLAESANYFVPQLKSTKKDKANDIEMSRKEKGVFLQKSTHITHKCKARKMYKELQEFHYVQDAVIKSDYSKHAFADFMKFVRNFAKQFS